MTVLDGWEPWLTPKGTYQAMQQGGMFLFEGPRLAWSYRCGERQRRLGEDEDKGLRARGCGSNR
jgi:hypothetical protein